MDIPDAPVANVVVTSYLAFGKEGRVYQAELLNTHQPIAIKCIEKWEEKIVALRKTLDFCMKLEHPNVVRHLHHQACPSLNPLEPPVYQVIMELCRGGTLRQVIRRIVVTPYLLQKWTKEIVEGLAYLHEKQCVHRDLKGDNILMTSRNLAASSVKIADLSTIAITGDLIPGYGTYPFMAPEMIADRNPNTEEALPKRGPLADIWSLGCVVIEMLNGASPQFFRENDGEKIQPNGEHAVLYFVMTGGFPAIPMGLPPDIEHFVRGCLKREPSDRSSAPELKRHRFLTTQENILSNWVLPEPINEIEGPVELQTFSVGEERIVPVRFIQLVVSGLNQTQVFQAERTDTNEIVAVKVIVLDTDPVVQNNQLKSLKADLQMLMALHHPNIVHHIHQQQAPVVSVYDPPRYQILMEFCEGPVLCNFVRKSGAPIPLIQKWTRQLVDAISYLHSYHCAHRNITGENILLSSNDVTNCFVKICGFGAIKRLQSKFTGTSVRLSSSALTPPRYMSPEMIIGEQRTGTKTDIWSLGCVVNQMMTGVGPRYYNQNGSEVKHTALVYFIANGGSPYIPKNLPQKLRAFIDLCFIRDPNDRPRAADLKRHGFLTADQKEVSNWVLPW